MKRRTRLQRKTPLRARGKTKYRRRERDLAFMGFIARQPCDLSFTRSCEGRVEVDHVGRRGLGQKSSDRETIPLCTKHHGERTDYRGYFKGYAASTMRAYCSARIRFYQALYQRKLSTAERAP